MKRSRLATSFLVALVAASSLDAADAERSNKEPVELVGRASDFWSIKPWCHYYWSDDFSFLLREEGNKKSWRIISREPTPHYNWRMGPTYTGLTVDWSSNPRVKVIGVKGIDRIPATFYYYRLDEPNLATVFAVLVETEPDVWKEYYVNNWFHFWGEMADPAIHRFFADKPAPYDVYGFLAGMTAPLSSKSQAILQQHPTARVYHGLIRSTASNPFGFEVELLHLTGPGKVLYGDPQSIPLLDDHARPRFQDATGRSGLGLVPKVGYDGCKPHSLGVEDFDADGLPDVIIGGFDAPHVHYYRNRGGLRFEDVTKDSGLETFVGDSSGIAVADYDRDGQLDVFIGSLRAAESRLYRGIGGGRFADVTTAASAFVRGGARSCAWSDIDGDGWLDLYVTSPKGANSLFRNEGRGTFVDIAQAAGVALADKMSLGCAFGDIDGDGLDDLFVANYQSQASTLLKNLGGSKFSDITAAAGLERRASAVGCVFADVFNRGQLDLYVTTDSWLSGANSTADQMRKMGHTVEPNVLYVNDGRGQFTPQDESVFDYRTLSHDAVLEDLDHDGLVDIYVGVDADSGNDWATSKGGNPLWTRVASRWREESRAWGIDHQANSVCTAAADLDKDGDLDLLLVNFYSTPMLYRNDTNDKHWLRIKALGTRSNPSGVGAQVSIVSGQDSQRKLVGFRHIQSGAGYARCSPLEAHFGLGSKPEEAYRVEVYFPAIKTRKVVESVKPGQLLVVREEDAKP